MLALAITYSLAFAGPTTVRQSIDANARTPPECHCATSTGDALVGRGGGEERRVQHCDDRDRQAARQEAYRKGGLECLSAGASVEY